jgi:hypothetical protein
MNVISRIACRRTLRPAIVGLLLGIAAAFPASAADNDLKSIAILDFELIDEMRDMAPATVEYQRLVVVRDQLAEAFAKEGLYRVVDLAPAAELMKRLKSEQRLHECNGCEIDIAKVVKADRVLVGWVQKVSNLILNLNILIEDTATGAEILVTSVDMRGNTDESWRRSVSYLVRQMVDKGQGNR